MRFYGGKKRVRKKAPRHGRCTCGKYIDQQPNNDRVNNRMHKVVSQSDKEYGFMEEED
jgi:hypothetical protein